MSPDSSDMIMNFLAEFKVDVKDQFKEIKADIKDLKDNDIKELKKGREQNKSAIYKVDRKINKYVWIGTGVVIVLSILFQMFLKGIIKI